MGTIEPYLRRLCDSPYRWIIVISVTLVLSCVLLIPLVDVYLQVNSDKPQLRDQLAAAHLEARGIDALETRVNVKLDELEQLESKIVGEDSISDLRKQLQRIARETGCTLRRLSLGDAVSRPWYIDDDPLQRVPDQKVVKKKTSFVLERRPVTLTVYGPTSSVHNMLQKIHQDEILVHTKSLEMRPEGRDRQNVLLDFELWYFALPRRS